MGVKLQELRLLNNFILVENNSHSSVDGVKLNIQSHFDYEGILPCWNLQKKKKKETKKEKKKHYVSKSFAYHVNYFTSVVSEKWAWDATWQTL